MAKAGDIVLYTDRDGAGTDMAAIVVQAGADSGEGSGFTVLHVFQPSGAVLTVEAVPAGTDLGNSSGTFKERT